MPVPTLPARRCLPLAAGLALLLCVPEPAASQEGTSTLVVHVRAVHAGRPLSGAQVILHGVGFGGTTAPDGSLRLHGLRPGSRTVEVRYLGYETRQALVTLVPGREATVRFLLAVEPIRLAEVRVRPRPSRLMRVGFYQRKASGNGTYFTREDIERLRPRTLSDMMRGVAGASVFMTGGGLGSTSFRGGGRRTCPVQFFVDGTLTGNMLMDEVRPEDVEGLEIYRGAASLPPEFNKGSAMCGAVVIWTRDR